MDNSRTYGIEFETISSITISELTSKINEALTEANTTHSAHQECYGHATNGRNFTEWIIKTDGSLICSHYGFNHPVEVVSPVLKGKAGLEVIKVVGAILNKYTKVNKSCGLHTHHGVTETEMKKVCEAWLRAEAVVISSLPRSRQNNYYCKTWKAKLGLANTMGANEYRTIQSDRYVTLNLQSYTMRSTVEFRCAAATANAEKAINWLLFTQGFVNAAQINVPSSINTIQKIKEFIAQNVIAIQTPKTPRSEMRAHMGRLIAEGCHSKSQILNILDPLYSNKRGSINTILNGAFGTKHNAFGICAIVENGVVKFPGSEESGIDTDYSTAASWIEYRYNSFAA